MAKFRESELTDILKEFKENSKVELEFEKSIDGRITLDDANITYDSKYGFINIKSPNGQFKINTTLVYNYEKVKYGIEIDLETLVIRVKNKT